MSVSSQLQCAVIAVAVLPCLATAQSSLLGSTSGDAPGAAYQLSAAPAAIATDAAPLQRNAAASEATAIPAPSVETDPIPAQTDNAPTGGASDAPVAASGPSLSSATAGFQSRTEHLTRQQLADRAMDQDGGRHGLGRDAVLMIIGGAAIVAGAIVGGTGGTALIVVGAVIGLTGLVLILS
jgi:hypothetical protein